MSLRPSIRSWTAADEPPPEYVVLGDDHLGEVVARRLHETGSGVAIVTESGEPSDLATVRGDPADLSTLHEAALSDASTVVVATRTDARNLLVAQLVRAHFDVPRIRVLTNRPDRLDSFEAADHETVCATTAVADAIVEGL